MLVGGKYGAPLLNTRCQPVLRRTLIQSLTLRHRMVTDKKLSRSMPKGNYATKPVSHELLRSAARTYGCYRPDSQEPDVFCDSFISSRFRSLLVGTLRLRQLYNHLPVRLKFLVELGLIADGVYRRINCARTMMLHSRVYAPSEGIRVVVHDVS